MFPLAASNAHFLVVQPTHLADLLYYTGEYLVYPLAGLGRYLEVLYPLALCVLLCLSLRNLPQGLHVALVSREVNYYVLLCVFPQL